MDFKIILHTEKNDWNEEFWNNLETKKKGKSCGSCNYELQRRRNEKRHRFKWLHNRCWRVDHQSQFAHWPEIVIYRLQNRRRSSWKSLRRKVSIKTPLPKTILLIIHSFYFLLKKKPLVHGSLNCRVLYSPCAVIRTLGVNYRKLTKLNCFRSRKFLLHACVDVTGEVNIWRTFATPF